MSDQKKWNHLRFIIPFSLKISKDKPYRYFKALIDDAPEWVDKPLNEGDTEQDVYDYIMSGFSEDNPRREEAEPEKTNSGFHWTWKKEGKKDIIATFLFKGDKDDKDYKTVCVDKVGVFLFKTGIGFIWFEYSCDELNDIDELIEFQNRFKEFARGKHEVLIEESSYNFSPRSDSDFRPFMSSEQGEDGLPLIWNKGEDVKVKYISKKVIMEKFGISIDDMHYSRIELSIISNGNIKVSGGTYEKKGVGVWIAQLLSFLDVEFVPERISGGTKIPDKAIIFDYVIDEKSANVSEEKAYWIANGYKRSYLCGESAKKEMQRPFKNVIWYATKEGCVYYVKPVHINASFFYDQMSGKFMRDYFTLFIKVLHQSYSLLKFAIRIEWNLSADRDSYLYDENSKEKQKEVEKNLEMLREIRTDINVFQIKSVATSVSHIHHQNRFYEYVLEQFRVKDDMESVSAGLSALNDLVKESVDDEKHKREGMMSNAMNVIGLLAFISALMDGVGFVMFCFGRDSFQWTDFWLYSPVFIVVGVILVWFGITFLKYKRVIKADRRKK